MPLITPLYAALAAVILIVLSLRVIGARRSHRVAIGDGADEDLARRIRAHGNFTEYTPLARPCRSRCWRPAARRAATVSL